MGIGRNRVRARPALGDQSLGKERLAERGEVGNSFHQATPFHRVSMRLLAAVSNSGVLPRYQ